MQIFLPGPDFQTSLSCLDKKRLWKQVVEAKQILAGQFPNHPASKMWKLYQEELMLYFNRALKIAKFTHGIKTEMHFELESPVRGMNKANRTMNCLVHISHRVNLLRKNFDHYSRYPWPETQFLDSYPTGYYWECEGLGKKAQADTDNWKHFAWDNEDMILNHFGMWDNLSNTKDVCNVN